MNLVLLFTYGISLNIWRRQGLIDRELAYYRELRDAGCGDVTLLTYDPDDEASQRDVEPFHLAARPRWIGALAYSLFAPLLRRDVFRKAAIVKSNQSRGAWTGIVAKLLYPRVLFVVRCGWVRTRETMTNDERLGPLWLRWAEFVERITFRMADAIFVVTEPDRKYVETTYGIARGKIQVMPNVVDTAVFAPAAVPRPSGEGPRRIVYVGRLVEYKNVQALIEAVSGLSQPAELVVIGDGPHRAALEDLARRLNARVSFKSYLPNTAVATEMRNSDVCVLPERHGCGMPKVLLESMGCGVLTVASGVHPHREVIIEGVNGLFCGVDPASIRACLERVFAMSERERTQITNAARREVVERYSMAALARREVAFYKSTVTAATVPVEKTA